jgi:hypothetical protein
MILGLLLGLLAGGTIGCVVAALCVAAGQRSYGRTARDFYTHHDQRGRDVVVLDWDWPR